MKSRFKEAWVLGLMIGVPTISAFFDTTTVFLRIIIAIASFIIVWAILLLYDHLLLLKKYSRLQWAEQDLNFSFINSLSFKIVEEAYLFNYDADKKYITEILKEFKTHFKNMFLKDEELATKKTIFLTDKDYVMLYLSSYLGDLRLTDKIGGEDVLRYASSEKYAINYSVTQHGYAFFKLLYIVDTFCENNPQILKTQLFYSHWNVTTSAINDGQYTYFRG